jgi:hypothetical protein
MDNVVDAIVRPDHEEDVPDDAHASDEHHRNDDIQQVGPICTSTHNIWNGNFFCVDVCEEHLSEETSGTNFYLNTQYMEWKFLLCGCL